MSNPNIPRHLGIILDGNRRWANQHGLPSMEGHKRGYENLKIIGQAALDKGVEYVSAFVFSSENWSRTEEEISYLMKLLLWVSKHEMVEFNKKNIRIIVLGSRDKLSKQVLKAIDSIENVTADNTSGTLVLCLNYGGQQEIIDMTKKIVDSGVPVDDINETIIEQNLYSPGIPPLDLLIRTSGEQRLSGFMLYRVAYAELYFTDKYWPDFSKKDLHDALAEYSKRQRRFGT